MLAPRSNSKCLPQPWFNARPGQLVRYTIAQTFSAHLTHHSPAVCSIKFRSNRTTKKLEKKSIPDSVKYSSGEFDECKQPQWYSLLELSFFFFEMIFLSTAVTTGTQRVHGSSSTMVLNLGIATPQGVVRLFSGVAGRLSKQINKQIYNKEIHKYFLKMIFQLNLPYQCYNVLIIKQI